jgi:DNA mismatch repair protein MutL
LPSVINDANPREMLLSMIDCVSETGAELGDDIYSRIALSMARAAAIKPGQSLSQDEIDRILSDLFKLQMSNYTPDGKTIVTIISNEDIARLFA